MTDTTVIRNAAWMVAWDSDSGGHGYLKNADLAFRDGTVVHLGPGYDGPAAREVDGAGLCVLPGLIDVHAHPMSEPMNKGYSEDAGNPRLGWSLRRNPACARCWRRCSGRRAGTRTTATR